MAVTGVVGDEVGDGRAGANNLGRVPAQKATHKSLPWPLSAVLCAAAYRAYRTALPKNVLSIDVLGSHLPLMITRCVQHAHSVPTCISTAVHDTKNAYCSRLCKYRLHGHPAKCQSLLGT